MTAAIRWPTRRLKHLCAINSRTLPEDTDPDLEFRYLDISSVDSLGKLSLSEPILFRGAPSRARRLLASGDVLVSTVRTYLAAIAAAPEDTSDLVCSTAFAVLTPRNIHPRFLYWSCRSTAFIQRVVARSVGVSYPAISPAGLADIHLPVPAQAEQQAVADFLDTETGNIDKLIWKRQRMLTLLEERAHVAVSTLLLPAGPGDEAHPEWPWLRGLDPSLSFVPLRRLATIQSGLTVDGSRGVSPEDAVTRPYLRVANVQDGYLNLEALTEVTVPHALAATSELRAGDVLMTEGGDLDKLGRGTVWRGEIPGCLHQNHVFAIRPRPGLLDSDYLALLTTTFHGRRYFESTGVRTTNLASTNRSKIMDFPVPSLPVARQRELVELVKTELANLAATTDSIRRQIGLLQERRQALITAAVSGELDVGRMWA